MRPGSFYLQEVSDVAEKCIVIQQNPPFFFEKTKEPLPVFGKLTRVIKWESSLLTRLPFGRAQGERRQGRGGHYLSDTHTRFTDCREVRRLKRALRWQTKSRRQRRRSLSVLICAMGI